MRTTALLLLCGVTALISGVAYFGASLSGELDIWLMIFFIVSTVLTLLFLLVLVVSAARRSIESSIRKHEESGDSTSDNS